jgi:hypothetical protein
VAAATILTANAAAGAAQAFQALGNSGYNKNPKYGSTIAGRISLIDQVEDCMRTLGTLK